MKFVITLFVLTVCFMVIEAQYAKDYAKDPKWIAVNRITWERVNKHPKFEQLKRKYGGFEKLGDHQEWHTFFQGIWKQVERERGIRSG